jgi:DNA-directed RNA polymerase subunit N (RpoN/RPB10)
MAVPAIRCFTCGKDLPHEKFRIQMEKCEKQPGEILDMLGCDRSRHECCRGMLLTSLNDDEFPVNIHTPGVLPPYVEVVPRTTRTVVIPELKKGNSTLH